MCVTLKASLISVVLPVYQTGYCLQDLYRELKVVLDRLGQSDSLRHELVFVEDCGADDAWYQIKNLVAQDPSVRGFKHLQNYGQHAAIATGVSRARGDLIVVMDADLKDPPTLIPELLKKRSSSPEIEMVLAIRENVSGSNFRKICSRLTRKGIKMYDRFPNGKHYGSFWLMTDKAIPYYLADPDRFKFSIKILDRIPLGVSFVSYNQTARDLSRSSYSFTKLVSLFSKLLPAGLLEHLQSASGCLAALSVVALYLFPSVVIALATTFLTVAFLSSTWLIRLRQAGVAVTHAEVIESAEREFALAK